MSKDNSKQEPAFDKAALTASERFGNSRDIVEALLEDGKQYTISQVEALVEAYLKGGVQ